LIGDLLVRPALELAELLRSGRLLLGVQLVGPPAGETVLLALAGQLERAVPWGDRLSASAVYLW
jgi:amidase